MARAKKSTPYRLAMALIIVTALILVWLSIGVGIIGRDGEPANMMYLGAIAGAAAGAVAARLRPEGMARAAFAMALAQAFVALIALLARLGLPWSGPMEILVLNSIFVALFAGAGLLFRRSRLG